MRRLFFIWRLMMLVVFASAPAWAQTTNQLYMTGTGTGNTPVIYTNGVDTNVNMALMPKGTGKVGIGTVSPSSMLEVYTSTDNSGITVNRSSNASVGAGLTFQTAGVQKWNWGTDNDSTENLYLYDNGPGIFLQTWDYTNGRVGIGTSSPGATLDVVSTSTGTAYATRSTLSGAANTGYAGYFTNTATGAVSYGIYASAASTTGYAGYFSGNVYATGTVYANLLQLTSDRRLKKKIKTLDPARALAGC